jgi:peptidoglycan/LPS O-acetylase OafA/YrhL
MSSPAFPRFCARSQNSRSACSCTEPTRSLYRAHNEDVAFPRKWVGVLALLFFAAGFMARQDFLAVLGLACLTFYAVVATSTIGCMLNSRPAIGLGNWSYSVYLWHGPAHLAIIGIFAAAGCPVSSLGLLDARLLALATALLVIGLSAVTYRYFERPMRHLLTAHCQVPPAMSPCDSG